MRLRCRSSATRGSMITLVVPPLRLSRNLSSEYVPEFINIWTSKTLPRGRLVLSTMGPCGGQKVNTPATIMEKPKSNELLRNNFHFVAQRSWIVHSSLRLVGGVAGHTWSSCNNDS